MSKFEVFKNLHHQDSPLILGNVWDVQSALLFQKLGYKAIGTSSAAVAASLGYKDGEDMPFEELLRVVKSIQSKITIPLTVDIEGGYSRNTSEILTNISALYHLDVVGINVEDSITTTQREIIDATSFGKTIQAIKSYLLNQKLNLFVNVRTDFYIMGLENSLEETKKRIKIYEKNGADGIFVPCVVKESDIKQIVSSTNLPINVMCMPDLPNFKDLEKLGIKRISMGPFLYNGMVEKLEKSILSVIENQSFNSIFD